MPREQLSRMNLNLDQIAGIIRSGSIDLPGGGVKTSTGEILLRTKENVIQQMNMLTLPLKSFLMGLK